MNYDTNVLGKLSLGRFRLFCGCYFTP